MKISDTLKIVARNLKRRKGRTILTAVGVTIGTSALVAIMSLGFGLQTNIANSINKFGNLTEIEVTPRYNRDNPKQFPQVDDNAKSRIKLIPGVIAVMPKIRLIAGQTEIEVGRRVGMVEVFGVEPKEAQNFKYQVAEGKYLGGGRNDAVISSNVSELLTEKKKRTRKNNKGLNFSESIPPPPQSKVAEAIRQNLINKSATLIVKKTFIDGTEDSKEIKIRIVGMLPQARSFFGGGSIYLPLETVKEINKWSGADRGQDGRLRGGREDTYDSLVVKVPDRQSVEDVANQIKAMGFNVMSPVIMLKEINKAFLVVQIFLGGIGVISLLVATIGITNTMVMSILERTREIGIMKVLGATIPNIRHLFLLEAGSIGFLGGVSGLVISYSIAGFINMIVRKVSRQASGEALGNIAVIPLWLALFALIFASLVGVLAGIYPALRAAKLSPLNAIRQE